MVLVAGGTTGGGGKIGSPELFDPTNNVFTSAAGGLAIPRASHTATLLPNGDVIVAGGAGSNTQIERLTVLSGQTNQINGLPAGNLAVARTGHLAILLASGEILFAGGGDSSLAFAEKYNPATGVSVPVSEAGHALAAVAVAHAKILLHGYTIQPHYGAELYDIESNRFDTITSPPQPFSGENYLTLSTGEIMMSGGYMSFAVDIFNSLAASFPFSVFRALAFSER